MILALSMSMCFFALVEDDLRGLDAVIASRLYMQGHWWNTLGKFFLVWLASISVGLIPLVGQLLSFIFTPFLLLYMVVVYRGLKGAAGEVEVRGRSRWLWVTMAAVGIILPLLGLVGLLVTIGPQQLPALVEGVHEGRAPGLDLPHSEKRQVPPVKRQKSGGEAVKPQRSKEAIWIWRDPVGDSNNPLLDIQEVSAETVEDELLLSVKLARPVELYFTAADRLSYSPLISFYLDTDVNRQTGGSPVTPSGRTGYDMAVDVLLEALPAESDKGRVHAGVYMLDRQGRQSLGPLDDSAVSVAGNMVQIRLPYTLLKVSGSDTIRVCYREAGHQQGSGLAKDKLVLLNKAKNSSLISTGKQGIGPGD